LASVLGESIAVILPSAAYVIYQTLMNKLKKEFVDQGFINTLFLRKQKAFLFNSANTGGF